MSRPLVVVPRAGRAPSALVGQLEEAGLSVVSAPSLWFDHVDEAQLSTALGGATEADVVAFTSATAVRSVARLPDAAWRRATLAATGPATAAAVVEHLGRTPSIVPERFVAESFADALVAAGVSGRRVWLPRAREARTTLVEALEAAEASVHVVVAYEARPDYASAAVFNDVDWSRAALIAVTSSRTLSCFDEMLRPDPQAAARATPVASIGPVTTATALGVGYPVALEAPVSTMGSLSEAIVHWMQNEETA